MLTSGLMKQNHGCCMGKPLISILGPTGVGKTDLAFRLACSLDKANILSVDTGSFYKAATIGTAKPPKEFTSCVRHWFIDILECQEVYSVGAFVSDCSSILQDLWAEGVTPIVVAGTLFYYYALVGERSFSAVPSDSTVREKVEEKARVFGEEYLRQELRKVDPEREKNILPGDIRRLTRALEIAELGFKPTEAVVTNKLDFDINLKIGLKMPRDLYRTRLKDRVEYMISAGLIEEVQDILSKTGNSSLPCLNQIGYKEVCSYLKGEIKNKDELVERIFLSHWTYARKQIKWLKKDKTIVWFDVSEKSPDTLVEEVLTLVQSTLENC